MPRFSIVTPVYDPDVAVLRETIASVRAQTFPGWEWILVDDASPGPGVLAALHDAAAADSRLVVVERSTNGHIVAASNDGIARARGEFIALLDHDDLLEPHALAAMSAAIDATPDADYLYSDEDKAGRWGRRYDTFCKPPWSPERLRGQMYTSHLSVLRTATVREVGGFREGFDGSQDHDLVLRVTENARRIVHVPEVLYHWRAVAGSTAVRPSAKTYAWEAGRRAVQEHCERTGIVARVDLGPRRGTYRLTRTGTVDGTVSVIIPTDGRTGTRHGGERALVVDAVRALLTHAGGIPIEVVVVHDRRTPPSVLDELRALAGEALVLVSGDASDSAAARRDGVAASSGRYVLHLADDVEIVSEDFVAQLVLPLAEPGVGATGPRLLFGNGTIAHAGIGYRAAGPYLPLQGVPDDEAGPFVALQVNREVTAVTGSCLALTRETWDAVGGATETPPGLWQDVDLGLSVARLGLRTVWIAHARALWAATPERVPQGREGGLLTARWGAAGPTDTWLPDGPAGPAWKRTAVALRRRAPRWLARALDRARGRGVTRRR